MLHATRLSATIFILTLMGGTASAAGPCASRSAITTLLKQQYSEVQAGRGLSSQGHLVELFVSPAGTWTILLSRADGLSCLADAGDAWETLPTHRGAAATTSRLHEPGPARPQRAD